MIIGVRTDCDGQIGLGHYSRCKSLAKELVARGCSVTFLMVNPSTEICLDLQGHSINVVVLNRLDVIPCVDWVQGRECDVFIVDHYALDHEWHSSLRHLVGCMVVIDDLANRRLDCDIFLDQNFYLDPQDRYIGLVPDDCLTLLGPRYCLLRDEFQGKYMRYQDRKPTPERFDVMIFFGGGDQTEITLMAMDAFLEADVKGSCSKVLGSKLNARSEEIKTKCRRYPDRFDYLEDVGNISDFMLLSDICVGAGGSISLERCYVGLPSIVVVVAENQIETTDAYSTIGAIDYLGIAEEVSKRSLRDRLNYYADHRSNLLHMTQASQNVFNGDHVGAVGVCDEILSFD